MKKINISCLPVAGIQNPYQFLMIEGLRSDPRLDVRNGINDRFFGILKTAIKQNPDYIHFDWETSYYYRRSLWMTLLNIPVFILQIYIVRYIFRCKLVWTPHNLVPHDSKYIKIHRFCRRFFARNMKWIRLFSKVSIEGAMVEFKCSFSKLIVIPEGSYVEYYTNKIDKTEARKNLNIADNKIVLLYTGFIKPYKGISELIFFFKNFFRDDAILIIAGKVMDLEYFETVKGNLNENIILVDKFLESEELQLYFNAADVVTLPFKKIENSGSVILAMGFKKPIIAPCMGVLVERLNKQPQLLYKNSINELLGVLNQISKSELEEIGFRNFNELKKYKWEDFAKAF